MPEKRMRGVRLTREERLEVRRLIGSGSSFAEAAEEVAPKAIARQQCTSGSTLRTGLRWRLISSGLRAD